MAFVELSERDRLRIDLALEIEDPAGIEAIELADVILEVFSAREPRQAELMKESLHRWALQWPRLHAGEEVQRRNNQRGRPEPL